MARQPRKRGSKARQTTWTLKKEFQKKFGFTPKIAGGIPLLSASQIRKIQSTQRGKALARLAEKKAKESVKAFRPHKADFGKIVMVGIGGKRNPQSKGRKGYAAYVSTTGKVSLLRAKVANPFMPRKLRDLQLPIRRNLHKKVAAFQTAKRVTVKRGKVDVATEEKIHKQLLKEGIRGDALIEAGNFRAGGRGKGNGKVSSKSRHDFSDSMVSKMANDFAQIIRRQKGQRVFSIETMVLVKLPNGSNEVIRFSVPIARNDKDAIKLGGIENFIRHKFYKFMAQELSYLGLITSGSANHIRKEMDLEEDITPEDWDAYQESMGRAATWGSASMQVCKIQSIEYRFEQSK